MFLTANELVEGIGSLSAGQGAAIGATFVIVILLCVLVIQTIDFLLTMFVYNHVAPKSNTFLRVLVTALIFAAINLLLSFAVGQMNTEYAKPITVSTVVVGIVDAIVGVLIAKLCTETFKGSLLVKSFKGALLYIPMSIGITVILLFIFGTTFIGAILPEIMRNINVPTA